MPRKDRLASPGEAGTKLLNILLPPASKYSSSVLARSLELRPLLAPIRQVHVGEDRAESPDQRRGRAIGAGYEEERVGEVAADRGEQAQRTEGAEDGAVGRIAGRALQGRLVARPTEALGKALAPVW